MKLPTEITINYDGTNKFVKASHYVTAKTKQLREFGYSNLTEAEVKRQLEALFLGKELNIIGKMMEREVIIASV